MTPFGERLRTLRSAHGLKLTDMAREIHVSAAYLSALEHGKRGRPSKLFVRQVCTYFNIIWDEAEELERLAQLSHPRVVVDTRGLSPRATELANRLARDIKRLPEATVEKLLKELQQ